MTFLSMYLDTLRVKFGEHDLKKEGDSIAIIKAEKLIKVLIVDDSNN